MDVQLSTKAEKPFRKAPTTIQQHVIKKSCLLGNGFGERIQKRLYPKEYHFLSNLFRVALISGWRLLYTQQETTLLVLEIISHKEYDRLFKY